MERRENSAEHSWSLAVLAMTLLPEVEPALDALRVLKMLLVHDIVEIDAGDTFVYGPQEGKAEREQQAAVRLFGLLPEAVGAEFAALWREFEDGKTREAAFAGALDRLMPLIQNFHNEGQSWREHGIRYEQVHARNQSIRQGSAALWEYAEKLMNEACARGFLPKREKDATEEVEG
jgi:putative hydrolase of HD superfamily